jgi:flagellar motor component MotA
MTRDEFVGEYHKISAKAVQLSEKARREGLLALEDLIDFEKLNKRDILEFGLKFVVDGTDAEILRNILSNIIKQEEDKYTRKLMEIKEEAVLSIQAGDNPLVIAYKLNSYTDIAHTDDPIIQKFKEKAEDKGRLSKDEIDALIGGIYKNG